MADPELLDRALRIAAFRLILERCGFEVDDETGAITWAEGPEDLNVLPEEPGHE